MKQLHADLSEMELRGLEERFAAPSTGNPFLRGSRGRETDELGVRYVELLRWGAPVRSVKDGSDDEVG